MPDEPSKLSRRAFFRRLVDPDLDLIRETARETAGMLHELDKLYNPTDSSDEPEEIITQEQLDQLAAQVETAETRLAEMEERHRQDQAQIEELEQQRELDQAELATFREGMELVERIRLLVEMQEQSGTPESDEQAAKTRSLLRRAVVALAKWVVIGGASGLVVRKTGEALYDAWVENQLYPLVMEYLDDLPEAGRAFWRKLLETTPVEAQPASPLGSPDSPLESPLPEPDLEQPGERPRVSADFDWVRIPAGEFRMGSTEAQVRELIRRRDTDWYKNESPQHRVYVPAFRIARFPVTNAQYRRFVASTGHRAPSHWQNGRIPAGKDEHPVVNVSWHDAQAFCKWAGVHLPSEAQWEKAARGTDGRIYPWGNAAPNAHRCNFNHNVGDTTPVGSYPAGANGLYDMAGNVWEWTSSKYRPYPYDADDGREDPEGEDARTLRGGSFLNFGYNVRCAYRNGDGPRSRLGYYGFRVVASPGP